MNLIQNTGFYCDLSAFTPSERQAHFSKTREIFSSADFQVKWSKEMLEVETMRTHSNIQLLSSWVFGESKCCPFLTFELHVRPQKDSLYLEIKGAEGAIEFVREEIKAICELESAQHRSCGCAK